MLIRLGYDIQFDIPAPVDMVGVLHVHPSRVQDLREPDELSVTPEVRPRPTRTATAIAAPAGWPLPEGSNWLVPA